MGGLQGFQKMLIKDAAGSLGMQLLERPDHIVNEKVYFFSQ